jgi:UDP-N-acetyl-2-amino-2-deoxyglucuronate dehydrogenase
MTSNPKNFAITGVAGFVAPRHLKAIKNTGHRLIAAVDPHDSVGLLDQFSYDVRYFKEYERFDRYLDKMSRRGESERVHYISICAPNYLHDAHIRSALRVGADAICEKPLVLNTHNLDALKELEKQTRRRIYTILQLRLHPSLIKFKKNVEQIASIKKHDVELTYITSRGRWYLNSWKGQTDLSGGLATNIGIHFFDALIWIFGKTKKYELHLVEPTKISGSLELQNAHVQWFLSIDSDDIRQLSPDPNKSTYRSLTCDGEEIEFSDGFTDLHTEVYKDILNGKGFGIEDVRPSIKLASDIRHAIG